MASRISSQREKASEERHVLNRRDRAPAAQGADLRRLPRRKRQQLQHRRAPRHRFGDVAHQPGFVRTRQEPAYVTRHEHVSKRGVPSYFAGARCFSSSNPLSTTRISVREFPLWSSVALNTPMKRPSGMTSNARG